MPFVQNFPFFSIFLPIVCGVVCLLLGDKAAIRITFFSHAALTLLSLALLAFTVRSGRSFTYMMGHFPGPFGNELRAGSFEAFMALLFSSVSLLSITGGLRDISSDLPARKIGFYFLMKNMLTGAMLAVIYTNDIFTAFVFIEIIVIAACSMVAAKPGGRTLAAAMVYLVMSLVGSSLLLLAIATLYSVTGHLLMGALNAAVIVLAASESYAIPLFVLTILMAVSFSIKSALFPFHSWLPGAHASATTAASAVLSGLIIKCYPILLIKLAYRVYGLETMGSLRVPQVLLGFGLAGIIYGSWMATRQRNIKRMLSYASIANIGYIFAAIGLNTEAGMVAACFHITVHAVGKAMLFTAAGGLAAVSGGRKDYDSMMGAARHDPLSGAAFIIGGLSMIGIPPFPGFMSKLFLATAAMETPYAMFFIPVTVIISTVLGAMYYFPVISRILSKRDVRTDMRISRAAPLSYRLSLASFLALTFCTGLFSQQLIRIMEQGLAVLG
jgi:multicomponent Na+:H+ antiporter subunit D